MTNIKKIGLSALAGTLAMTSAYAGAVSITGSMEVTYTRGSGYQTDGNPLGQANDLTITASTELDNGITVAYKNTTSDTTLTGDSELVFGNILGGGTIAMTSTGSPLSAIDDVTPNAFHEATGQVGSIQDVNGSDGTYGVRYTLSDVAGSGVKFDYMYFPQHGSGDATGDQATSGANASGNKDAHEISLTGNIPGVEGLSAGIGYAILNYDLKVAGDQQDQEEATAYLKYAFGPVTVGAQLGGVSEQGLGNITYRNQYLGISYAVSDDLSISYNRAESLKGAGQATSGGEGREQTWDSIAMSYSMGGMTINISDSDCSNCSYTAARSIDETAISLSVAF